MAIASIYLFAAGMYLPALIIGAIPVMYLHIKTNYLNLLFAFLSEMIDELKITFGIDKNHDEKTIEIVRYLKSFRTNRIIHNEFEIQLALEVYLKNKYQIFSEFRTKRGESIDFIINKKYAIEVKIAKSNNTLRNLISQIEEYMMEYPRLIVFIYDYGAPVDLNYYASRIKEKGANVIICKGRFTSNDLDRREDKYGVLYSR
ncbi:MAG: hypothetical protein Q8P05_01060 [Candidatus Diapherotrites archaeon]|nr:hypothetical protein [Candidatus Diapherotrites archaeon]